MDRVYLKEYTETEEIITAFEDAYIDLVVNDVSGKSNLGYGGNTETRYFTTTNMHYLGLQHGEPLRQLPAVPLRPRSWPWTGEYAADTLMNGGAVAAALPVSPRSPLYDSTRRRRAAAIDMEECARHASTAPASRTTDNDGWREYVDMSASSRRSSST